jgi:hypothetical protein
MLCNSAVEPVASTMRGTSGLLKGDRGVAVKLVYTNEEDGKMLGRYWTTACQNCSLKSQCTTGPERRITRWEHEHLLEAVQQRLDAKPTSHAPASRDGRASVRHDESPHGGDTLPHQNASKSSRRDGSLGPGLQFDTGHEHRRDQAADGCDRGLKPNRSWHLTDLPAGGVFYTAKTQNGHDVQNLPLAEEAGLIAINVHRASLRQMYDKGRVKVRPPMTCQLEVRRWFS